MKTKSDLKKNIASIGLKILIMIVFMTLLLTQYVFAEENYFTIKVPKGYQYAQYDEGDMKLQAIRIDGKLNFNIQVYDTIEYSDYSEDGLTDLIRTAGKSTSEYNIGSVSGKISTINEYPCYDLTYLVTSMVDNDEMYIRQIYIYEDKYSYLITIGGESEEILEEKEIQEAMDTFTIEHYKRENVLKPEKEEMSTALIVILIVAGVIIVLIIIIFIIKKIKNRKGKNKAKKVEVKIKEDNNVDKKAEETEVKEVIDSEK